MFLWFPVLDLARAPRRTARKKGSGYENADGDEAHYSSPVHFRFANYMQPRSQFWDVSTYGKMIRFMTFFDVTEMLKNIMTYSRLRFDFPNTLVETREQHCGP